MGGGGGCRPFVDPHSPLPLIPICQPSSHLSADCCCTPASSTNFFWPSRPSLASALSFVWLEIALTTIVWRMLLNTVNAFSTPFGNQQKPFPKRSRYLFQLARWDSQVGFPHFFSLTAQCPFTTSGSWRSAQQTLRRSGRCSPEGGGVAICRDQHCFFSTHKSILKIPPEIYYFEVAIITSILIGTAMYKWSIISVRLLQAFLTGKTFQIIYHWHYEYVVFSSTTQLKLSWYA